MLTPDAEFVRLPAVLKRYSISRSTLWRWLKAGAFPKPAPLGPSPTPFWKVGDLLEWEQSRVAAGRG